MPMCVRISLLTCFFLLFNTPAGAIVYQWGHSYGDPSDQTSTSVAVDASGNVIFTGLFDGSVNFGAGAIAYGGPSLATFLTISLGALMARTLLPYCLASNMRGR